MLGVGLSEAGGGSVVELWRGDQAHFTFDGDLWQSQVVPMKEV